MKKLSLLGLALALLFTACDKKDGNNNKENLSGDPVLATFKITSPGTYANGDPEEGTADENKISVIEFFMFDANGVRDENTSEFNYGYHKYVGSASKEISFMVKSGINKKVLVAVNTELGENGTMGYDDVEKLIEKTQLNNTNSQQIASGKYVMSGKQVCDIEENRTDNEVTITIARVASKIEPPKVADDFVVNIPAEDLQEVFADETVTSENIEFTLNSFVVINGLNRSYVYTYYNSEDKEYKEWDMWAPGGTYQKTTFDAAGEINVVYSGTQGNSTWLTTPNVFVYENSPTETVDAESGITGYVKDEVYAFLINGTLTNTTNNESLTRYWRVNLIRDDNYKIFRNTIYRVTLDEVRTVGYGTPKEAEEDEGGGNVVPKNDQTAIQVSVEILPWNVKIQNTDF